MGYEMIDILSCARSVLKAEISGLFATLNSFDESFVEAVNTMHKTAGHVILTGMGKPGHIAKKISATMSSTGTKSFFIHPAEAAHGDLGVISSDDLLLVLSLSGETQELFPLLSYAKRFGIKIIGITGNADSSLGKIASTVIRMPKMREACPNNLAPTTSSTVMLAIGDALSVCLLQLNQFSREDFKQLHPGGALGRKLLKVKDLMHHDMPLVQHDDLMSDVIITMTKMSFGCAGVVDRKGNLIGIITDGDLRRHISNQLLSAKACEVMTKSPIVVTQDTFASESMNIMNTRKITSLFVLDNLKPIGIIHIHDCLRAGLN